jgi:site-specific DNA recombinase
MSNTRTDMKDEIKYCQYCRKSSESRERQALSIQDQEAECQEYADREKIVVPDSFRFQESKSAFKPNNRRAFERMVELIKAGAVNAILTWKPDRLSRNPEEGGKILQLLQDGTLKEIRTATGEIYTQDSDHLILQIHFGMANQYSRNLSQNVKRGLLHKVKRKEYPRRAPIGFVSTGEDGRKNLVPHPTEAPIIKELFNLASTGNYSLGYLMDWLYETKKFRNRSGHKIYKSHLHAILTCSTYYGYFLYQDELYEGSYTPIISKKIFDRVQDALNDRSKPKVRSWKPFLNGIIKCGECGCAITTTVKRKFVKREDKNVEFRYNHCTHRKGNCAQTPMSSEELEEQLINSLSKIEIDKDIWQLGIKLLKAKYSGEFSTHRKRLRSLQNDLDKVHVRKNNLIVMRADDDINKDEFVEQKNILMLEQARIQSLMSDINDSSDSWLERAEEFFNIAYSIKHILKNGSVEEKRNMILSVGQNFILEDKKLDFQMTEPFDILLKPEYRSSVMPRLDSNQD